MARSSQTDKIVGVVLVVLGVLALLDWLDLGFVVTLAAIGAIVAGILVLIGTLRGSKAMGIVLLIVGILLLVPVGGALRGLVGTLLAIVLLVLGILKLMGKW